MIDTSIYAGSRGYITFAVSVATQQFVAHLVVKRTNQIVGKFSYPARDGYQTLTKELNNYTGHLTEGMTKDVPNEILKIEVKPFINENAAPIGVAELRKVSDNTLKTTDTI